MAPYKKIRLIQYIYKRGFDTIWTNSYKWLDTDTIQRISIAI